METIIAKLIAYISNQMQNISIVDEDYGQLENIDVEDKDMYPLTFPAVLIECTETDWSNIASQNQKGEATIRVRLAIDCYDDTHAGYDRHLIKAIERAKLSNDLHHYLQGYRPLEEEAMVRTKTRFYTHPHGIKVYEHTYTLTVSDIVQKKLIKRPEIILRENP